MPEKAAGEAPELKYGRLNMEVNYDLKGKRALITGSSRGIGSAIALELARAGADIVLHCAKTKEKAEALREEISALGVKCEILIADLCDPAQTEKLGEAMGDIDLLILNASVQIKKDWEEISVEDFYTQVNCNYLSSMILMQKAVPHMKAQGFGRIVTIGSVQEKKPHPKMLVYSSSKCAQTGLAMSLAAQLAPFGITVNNVAPGVIATDRNREALADAAYAAQVSASIPAGFYGEKEDMAGIVRLLCSDAGRYITGASIYADGGKSL